MIDINLFYELTVLEENGTLSKAADSLFISQPALSRSMAKLETELGVILFNRSKNKLTLNENGKLAAAYARELIMHQESAINSIRSFDKKNKTISIASCAPMPLVDVTTAATTIYSDFTISSEINSSCETILKGLQSGVYDIAVLNHDIENEDYYSQKLTEEKLFIVVDKDNTSFNTDGVYLKDLNGQQILLYSQIGFWYDLLQSKTPSADLLIQHDDNTLNTLIYTTSFPFFVTDKSVVRRKINSNKVLIPVLDNEATACYYCVTLKSNYKKFESLFNYLSTYVK